jgi:hypothetical protein
MGSKEEKNMILCRISNQIVSGQCNLDVMEWRIIMHMISKIGYNDTEFETYKYYPAELQKIFNQDLENPDWKNTPSNIINICRQLLEKNVSYYEPETKTWKGRTLFQGFDISSDGEITAKFNADMIPFLLYLKREYTLVQFQTFLKFKNPYAQRLYMLGRQYLKMGKYKLKIDTFRDIFALAQKYSNFFNLNLYIIAPALAEINEKSEIIMKIYPDETIRVRKSYKYLWIEVKEKGREEKNTELKLQETKPEIKKADPYDYIQTAEPDSLENALEVARKIKEDALRRKQETQSS